jgi:hypothetical protein
MSTQDKGKKRKSGKNKPPPLKPPPAPTPPPATPPPPPNIMAAVDPIDAFLADLNGDDAYSSSAQSRGKLSTSEYLQIPDTMTLTEYAHYTIGTKKVRTDLSKEDTEQIYALNKLAFGTDDRAIKMAWLRVMLVKAGWAHGEYEIVLVTPLTNADVTMTADLDKIKGYNEDASKLSFLLPLATEYVFRVSGHHYLTSLSTDYNAKYVKFFNACVEPNLTTYLMPEDLYHKVGHWTPLQLALDIAQDETLVQRVPNAITTRSHATPAGTAVIGTTDAVFSAMKGAGYLEALKKASGLDIDVIITVTEKLKKDPARYHLMPFAYNVSGPSTKESIEVAEARVIAIALAPVTQGFIDALPKTSSLAGTKALAKHADVNPILRKRSKIFFKEVGKAKAGSIAELFAVDKRTKADVAEEEVDEDDT